MLVDEMVHTLSGAGADIWDLLAAPSPVRSLVEQLAGRYDTDRADITEDVVRAVDELLSAGVLEAIPSTAR